jgi:hypothetical protein
LHDWERMTVAFLIDTGNHFWGKTQFNRHAKILPQLFELLLQKRIS